MPSKTSWFNKELFKQDFRNVGWVGVVYFVSLLGFIPLQLLMALDTTYTSMPNEHGLFSTMFGYVFQMIAVFLMPLLMAVFTSRYMHVKKSSDFMHSLPIKREKLFHARIMSGLTILLVPVILISLIMLIFYGVMDTSHFYSLGDIGYWAMVVGTLTTLVFFSGLFVGSVTGLSAVQGILTLILLLFPIGIYLLVYYNLSLQISGMSPELWEVGQIEALLSPVVDAFEFGPAMSRFNDVLPIEYGHLVLYLVYSVIFYMLARFSYHKRALETASQAIAVSWLKPVFTLGLIFCLALTFGFYFGEVEQSVGWLIFGYVAGGTVGFILSTMLLEKTWRIFHKHQVKRFSIYALEVAVLISVLPIFLQGYENYVPEKSEIEGVFVADSYYDYERYQDQSRDALMDSEKSIEASIQLHKSLMKQDQAYDSNGESHFILYKLKNGREVYRHYYVDEEQVQGAYAALVETKDYKDLTYPITKLNPNHLNGELVLEPPFLSVSKVRTSNISEINDFLDVLREDLYSLQYEDFQQVEGKTTFVNYIYNNNQYDESNILYDLSIDQSYTNTIQWLKDHEMYDDAFLQADDIQEIEFYPWSSSNDHPENAYMRLKDQENVEKLTVTDASKLEEAINVNSSYRDRSYLMVIHSVNGTDHRAIGIKSSDTPDFVKEYFND